MGMFVISTAHAANVLTPNTNNKSGQLPNGFSELSFRVSDGNVAKTLKFPTKPKANDIVHFESVTKEEVYIDLENTDVPGLIELGLEAGDRYHFKYNASKKIWEAFSTKQFPVNGTNETVVKINKNEKVSSFAVENGRWTRNIKLPATAPDFQYAIIESKADLASTIVASGETYPLKKGQKHWFSFMHGEWVYLDPEEY